MNEPDLPFTPLPLPIDGDGYVVVPDRPKGRKCGRCGMKFDYGKFYGYSCPQAACPMGWSA
jgi:hypothetical protein